MTIIKDQYSVAIAGVGSVGGHMAARLASVGVRPKLIARRETLAALRTNGLTLRIGLEESTCELDATESPEEIGQQDIVIVSVKFRHLVEVLKQCQPMIGPQTFVVFAMNGLPAWFLETTPVADNPDIRARLDPGGEISRLIPRERAVACSVTSGGRRLGPGRIENTTPHFNKLVLGLSDGSAPPQIQWLARCFEEAGYRSSVSENIRADLWQKMIFNAALAPISTTTNRTAKQTCSDPETRAVAIAAINEVVSIGAALGITIEADAEALTDPERAPDHKPSFLADLEAGIPLEIENGVLAVREIARACGVAAPHLTTVAALMAARSPKQDPS